MSATPTSERAALAWTRWYTRGLPIDVGEARQAELVSDLYEHRAHAREAGVPERHTSAEVVTRLVEGMPADVSWRRAQRSRARSTAMLASTDNDRRGYPMWLTIVLALMGGLALFVSLASFVGAFADGDEGMAVWALLLLLVGSSIVAGLLLTQRAPRASVALVALGAVGFGFTTYWMVLTIVAGVVVAAAALLSIPRVVGPRPAT